MREEIRYIADDGKVFDDEYECKEYELECDGKGLNIIAYNRLEEKINVDEVSNMYYVNLPTQKTVDYINKLSRYYGYSTPESIGKWYYDDERDKWVNIDDKIAELKAEIDRLERIFKEV